jgi:hypothetical protein
MMLDDRPDWNIMDHWPAPEKPVTGANRFESAIPGCRGGWLLMVARAARVVGVWSPFFALLILVMPQFFPIYEKLEQKGTLPGSTSWFIMFEQLNAGTFCVPTLAFLALLIASDFGVAQTTANPIRRPVHYRAWVFCMLLAAAVACVFLMYAILSPVFIMSKAIQ